MHFEQQMRLFELHRKAHRVALLHYIRKGRVPQELTAILHATNSVPAFLKYNPDQPRVPAGSADGGQWTSGDEGGDDGSLLGDVLSVIGSLVDDALQSGLEDAPDQGAETIADPTQIAQEEVPPEFEDIPETPEESPATVKPPFDQYPTDPTQPPAPGFEWRGNGPPGSSQGNWHNPATDEDLHPDLDHGPPQGPHWDYDNPSGSWRLYPDGRIEPKIPSFVLTA